MNMEYYLSDGITPVPAGPGDAYPAGSVTPAQAGPGPAAPAGSVTASPAGHVVIYPGPQNIPPEVSVGGIVGVVT